MIKTFEHELFGRIRTITIDEDIHFNLYDTGIALGYTKKNSIGTVYLFKDRVINLCKSFDIKGVYTPYTHDYVAINKDTNFENTYITEDSLYDLVFESNAKNARQFRKWVTSEILPTIRKEGMYISPDANHEQVNYNVHVFIPKLETMDVVKIFDEVSQFLSFHREKKTRLLYKKTNVKRHGNKKYKTHIESMEDIRKDLVSFLDAKIDQFNNTNQAGLAQEYVRIKGMVEWKVENMRYRTAACK
ncbi:hypothetical protein H6F38_23215 [Paenibacillus sp. EKM208P]|nr:hypothetical protein H6F38_23215 [Paenibacillus sp. EKM208P]